MKTMMLALLFVLVGCGGTSHSPQLPQPSVIFFGDSIFGAWDLATYFPGKQYVNGSMFDYRTDQLKALLPDVLTGNKVCHGLDGDAIFPLSCVQVTPWMEPSGKAPVTFYDLWRTPLNNSIGLMPQVT